MIEANFYKILGVHADMDNNEIKYAYRILAREHHPDRGGDSKRFTELALAFAAVRDAALRQRLAARWALLHERCASCGGKGYLTKQLSFVHVVKTPCGWCEGAGFV